MSDNATLELQLQKLEMSHHVLRRDVEELEDKATGMKDELSAIQKNLNQIKYFAMGATVIYFGSATGLLRFISLLAV